jgi:hypothetical protein
MLEELGVLPFKREHYSLRIRNLMGQIGGHLAPDLHKYMKFMSIRGRSDATQFMHIIEIRDLSLWLASNSVDRDIFLVQEDDLRNYFEYLVKKYKGSHVRNTFYRLNRFYTWCADQKLVFCNPVPDIECKTLVTTHTICTEKEVRKICAFIKKKDSDPQLSMMLALSLFYATTSEQLRQAQFFEEDDTFLIKFSEPIRSYKSRARRPKELILQDKPEWFRKLQKRFHKDWTKRQLLLKETYPRRPLLIHDNYLHNRGVGRQWIADHIKKATLLATGHQIPLSVLRQTCGTLHMRGQDASSLRNLGWASHSAFNYTWNPLVYYTPSK